ASRASAYHPTRPIERARGLADDAQVGEAGAGSMEHDFRPVQVLIGGGGVAALEATLALRALAAERVAITIVAPELDFTYRPLRVAEPFRVGEARRFPLRPLVAAAGAELRQGGIAAVDPDRRVAVKEGGQEELPYEVLLLALGAVPREALPGALTFRGPGDGPALETLLEQAVDGELRSLVFALPGGGTAPPPPGQLALPTPPDPVPAGSVRTRIAP